MFYLRKKPLIYILHHLVGTFLIHYRNFHFRTPITNRENILNYNTKAWEESPQEIKDLYPENYLERFKKGTEKFLKISMSDKPQEVVGCLEEAVLALDPKYVYNPGTLYSRLTYWVLCRLPKPIADTLIHDQCAVKFCK